MCNRFCSIGFHCFPIKSQLSHQISWRSLLVPLSFHQQFDARLFGGSHQFFEVLHCIAMGKMSKRHQMDDQIFCVMFTKRGFLMFPDVYEICQTYYHHDIIMLSSCNHHVIVADLDFTGTGAHLHGAEEGIDVVEVADVVTYR